MLDDRDIVCETDYSPLSGEELVEAIERYAAIMHTAPLIDFDLEWITGPARALLARAEAAEVGRDEANLKALQAEYRIIQLAARVAELEAALIGMDGHMARLLLERNDALNRVDELEAAQAAQQWRPVTEEPATSGMYPVRVKYRGQVHLDREMRNWISGHGWNDGYASAVEEWYPLPQSPDAATEPTP